MSSARTDDEFEDRIDHQRLIIQFAKNPRELRAAWDELKRLIDVRATKRFEPSASSEQ